LPKAAVRALLEWLLPVFLRRVPASTKDRLRRRLPGALSRAASYLKFSAIDWSATRAHLGEFPSIRLNVKGREPLGVVEPGPEYEELRDHIIAQLQAVNEPDTGLPLFECVARREELYQGPYTDEAPDIIVVPRDVKYTVTWKSFPRRVGNGRHAVPSFLRDEPHWRGTSGKHRFKGILIACGGPISPGTILEGARLIDVAPTILHVFGLPIPSDMDGRVLEELLDPAFRERHPVRTVEARPGEVGAGLCASPPGAAPDRVYSAEEAEKIERMLKSLGYIE
jgi:hypothetical protein